jgi:hypothetical protein
VAQVSARNVVHPRIPVITVAFLGRLLGAILLSGFRSAQRKRNDNMRKRAGQIAMCSAYPVMVFLTSLLVCDAYGGPMGVQHQLGDYGVPVDNLGPSCAPSATANSFQYLVGRYPGKYGGTNLIRNGDPLETRNELAAGWFPGGPGVGGRRDGMDFGNPGLGTGGASDKDWWQVKLQWINDFAPGTTTVAGMVDNADAPNWIGGSNLTVGAPTFDFLLAQMLEGEDVEIAFQILDGPDAGEGHAVTLAGITSDDSSGRVVRTISYLDPNNTSHLIPAELTTGTDGSLGFTWDNGRNARANVRIRLAYAESPLPEPSTATLVVLALPFLIGAHILGRRVKGDISDRYVLFIALPSDRRSQ